MQKETEPEETIGILTHFIIGGISIWEGRAPWASILATPMILITTLLQLLKRLIETV